MIVFTERRPGEPDAEWEKRREAHWRQVEENEAKLRAARERHAKLMGERKERPLI